MLHYIQTRDGLTVMVGSKPRTVSSEHADYAELVAAIKAGADEAAVRDILDRDLRRVEAAVAALTDQSITEDVAIRGGTVLFRGEPVHNTVTERILQQLKEGFNLTPMARFLANVMENPSYRAVEQLYPFLEYGRMPITEDGCFLAYKAVRRDFTDIHTGTFNNSVGAVCEMRRNRVDEDPNQTCSAGLHVCSFTYLPHFAHADGHVVVCKINPRDVVAVPTDYHNTKMRVCRYEVTGVYENYYVEHPECRLSQVAIATEDHPFLVVVFGDEPESSTYRTLLDAVTAANGVVQCETTSRVEVYNGMTDTLLDTLVNEGYEPPLDDEDDRDDDEDERDDDERDGLDDARENEGGDDAGYRVVEYATMDDFHRRRPTRTSACFDDLAAARNVAFSAYQRGTVYAIEVQDAVGDALTTIS